jgi:hypothetical protein
MLTFNGLVLFFSCVPKSTETTVMHFRSALLMHSICVVRFVTSSDLDVLVANFFRGRSESSDCKLALGMGRVPGWIREATHSGKLHKLLVQMVGAEHTVVRWICLTRLPQIPPILTD